MPSYFAVIGEKNIIEENEDSQNLRVLNHFILISFAGKKAFWMGKPSGKQYFSKTSLKDAVKFLIETVSSL